MEDSKFSESNPHLEKIHPRQRANILSKLFFCWLLPTFVKGFRRELVEKDLCGTLKQHESSLLGDQLEDAWNKELKLKRNPSLWRALGKVFGKELILTGLIFIFIEFGIKLSQPLFLSGLLSYYSPNSQVSQNEAYLNAGFIVFASFLQVIVIHSYMLFLQQLGMRMRVACCSLIYRKALKLSKSALAETTIGQLVNLLSNDVNRFDFSVIHFHNLWGAPLETILILYLLYTKLGITSIVGVGFLLLFIPLQMYMGKKTASYRLKTAIRTDERVRLMNEIISGIQVIKMYTWEKPFAKLVELARVHEIKEIRGNSFLKALTISFVLFINRTAIYLCILTYVLCGNSPTHQYVFVCTSFYGILRQAVTMFFPQGVTSMAECNVSIKRIKKFLMYDEVKKENMTDRLLINSNGKLNNEKSFLLNDISSKSVGISIKDAAAQWVISSQDTTLEDVNFNVDNKQLVAIVGPVGSGKTTLLHVILKELPLSSGDIDIVGTISYASQEPWLFAGSVRQNILFGEKYDEKKYKEVVRVCALERDFTLFQYGDRTIVGERGVMLSGGQRARINLARAVYKDANIYLLDDPLSAVDTHVGRQLFDECIRGFLANKCVVLVTHQLQYLHKVSKIYLMENGTISESGTYEQLQNSGKDFTNLLNDHQEEEQEVGKNKEENDKEKEENKNNNVPTQNKEEIAKGKISSRIYKGYLKAGGSWIKTSILLSMFLLAQILGSGNDYFITYWVNLEQDKHTNVKNYSLANATNNEVTFKEWFFTEQNCLIIYSTFVGVLIILTLTRSIAFYRFCITASRRLHNSMFNNIVNATMKFFNTNPSGRILNRFSKDIGAVDENLPMTIIDTVQIGLTVFAISLVVASVNPWVLLPTGIILTIFYCLRIVFLASSRPIKRMEGTTRSPVFSHLNASLQGLTTIRAFKAEEILKKEFDNHQNLHSSAFYMFLGANRTFGFWLDFHCVIYISLVTLSFLFIEKETYGGNVGLAITQSISLCGMFQWGMRQWSELENQMTSVERVIEYTDIKGEDDKASKDPPKYWPENGNIKFEDVSLKYSLEDPYVLKKLNFQIESQEKVGIVGRTGAGKSSLISALFRLTEIEGKIIIDNVNTKEISLSNLRSKVSIIPQEPVLFSGTLRKNLDPFDEYDDNILWSAIEEVELKSAVSELPCGLDSKMSEGGTNFSVGQRQLVCLARAIIRKNKILVLDEATANVDPQTDALIQSTIRNKFAECTVLTIAHRLHTIMDSDKVLVMDAGCVAEFGHPNELLQNHDGVFYGLVKQTGKAMAENLTNIAEKSFKQIKQ